MESICVSSMYRSFDAGAVMEENQFILANDAAPPRTTVKDPTRETTRGRTQREKASNLVADMVKETFDTRVFKGK
jgi:hypothetical protein